MMSTMTSTGSQNFSSNFFPLQHPFVKMKCPEPDWTEEEMVELLEKIELDFDFSEEHHKTETMFSGPSKRHLSGGTFLVKDTSSQFPTIIKPQISNPFRDEKFRKFLEAECKAKENKDCTFSSTNPFSVSHNFSQCADIAFRPRGRTMSQTSTRPVSPTERTRPNSFFALPETASQATQTIEPQLNDLQCLLRTFNDLQASGWYYENVRWTDSKILLQNSEPGTFLLRTSSDPRYLLAMSVQTTRGPTSVRLHYDDGRFRLDAEAQMVSRMPTFESVLELLEYYKANTEATKRKQSFRHKSSNEQVWIDSSGKVYSHIMLWKPLRKPGKIPNLQHIARLAVNRQLRKTFRSQKHSKSKTGDRSVPMNKIIDGMHLPPSIETYLKEYPYSQ